MKYEVRDCYLDVLSVLAEVDGNFSGDEKEAIVKGLKNINVLDNESDSSAVFDRDVKSLEDIDFSPLSTDWQKHALITLMVTVGHSDNDYAESEKLLVREVSRILLIPEDVLKLIEAKVEETMDRSEED